MDTMSSRSRMLFNCRFIVSSCARLVFSPSRIPRSFAFTNVYKWTPSTPDFVHNSSHLTLAWTLFRFCEQITKCFDRMKSARNILLGQDTPETPFTYGIEVNLAVVPLEPSDLVSLSFSLHAISMNFARYPDWLSDH